MKRLITSALAGLLLAFSVQQACATILFAGGEDLDGTSVGTVTIDTTAGHFRTGYARAALNIVASALDPNPNRFITPTLSSQSIIWLHAEEWSSGQNSCSTCEGIGIYGSDGVRRLLIRGGAASGQVKISTRNSAGTITDIVSCTTGAWPVGLAKIDWYINYAVAGETALYINGTQVCDFVGDITTNSVTAINAADFAAPFGSSNTSWSEIIVSTTDTRSMNLMTCAPQANGTNMAWSGSYANVNPTTINDASVITSGTSGQIAEFTCPALPSGTFTVPAVTQSIRGVAGSSGPQNFYFIARPSSGSTDYNNGATTGFTSVFGNYYNVWSNNPACSCGWTTNDVTTGVNFGLESEP